jgi:hypothetical protein
VNQKLTDFDISALLDNDEAISEYLSQVLADGDELEIRRAIDFVIKVYQRRRTGTETESRRSDDGVSGSNSVLSASPPPT